MEPSYHEQLPSFFIGGETGRLMLAVQGWIDFAEHWKPADEAAENALWFFRESGLL